MLRIRSTMLCCFGVLLLLGWSVGCSSPTPPGEQQADGGTSPTDGGSTVDTPPTGCKTNADCTQPGKTRCNNGTCGPECTTDNDCTDVNKPKCTNGSCEAIPGECSTNQDCPSSKPVCTQGVCGPCSANVDCVNPQYPECQNGACVRNEQPQCQTSNDCKDLNKPICLNGICTARPPQCSSNTDCKAPTPVCSNGTCVQGECTTNTDCSDPTRPVCRNYQCEATCRSNADCKAPTPICRQGQCTGASGCSSDKDCATSSAGRYCDLNARVCRSCLVDKHCKDGELCDIQKYTCVPRPSTCNGDADCKAKDPKLPYCVNNACVGCSASTDCKLGYVCSGGSCVEGCQNNRDCPTDKPTCSSKLKKCVACETDKDCSGNDVCDPKTYTCSYRCTTPNAYDRGCAQRRLPYYCDGKTRLCVACVATKISPSYPYDQGCNSQAPRCNEATRTCVQCKADNDCSAGPHALSAKCDSKAHTCYECTQTSDCRRGAVCNTKTRMCIKGCLSTNDCPRGKLCGDYNQCVDCSSKSPTCAPGLVCHVKLNSCVECVQDSDCKTGAKCDTGINRCLTTTNRTQCLPCTKAGSQAECASGYQCIDAPLGYSSTTSRKERVCLKACKVDSDCEQGYTCCSANNSACNSRVLTGLDGYCYPRYSTGGSTTEGYVTYRSCKAVLTQGLPCTVNGRAATCGNGPQTSSSSSSGDALCEAANRVCQLPCRSNNECTTGYSCKCPAGYTLRGSYCYDSNNQYAPARCLK